MGGMGELGGMLGGWISAGIFPPFDDWDGEAKGDDDMLLESNGGETGRRFST